MRAALPGVHVLAGSVARSHRAGVRRVRPQSVRGPRRGVRADHGRDHHRAVAPSRRSRRRRPPSRSRSRRITRCSGSSFPRWTPRRIRGSARDHGGDDGLVRALRAVRPGDAVVDERAALRPVRASAIAQAAAVVAAVRSTRGTRDVNPAKSSSFRPGCHFSSPSSSPSPRAHPRWGVEIERRVVETADVRTGRLGWSAWSVGCAPRTRSRRRIGKRWYRVDEDRV